MTTRDELLSKLAAAGVPYELFEHPAAFSATEQVKEMESQGGGAVIKNLFLKDKKNRLYVISLVTTTRVDLKVISARLGVGKHGINMANEALIRDVLQVPLGSVTPLAMVNHSADSVYLLLDQNIKKHERVLVHPLINTASVALTPAALEAALASFGRKAVYVDLEADPTIDKDSPPDLAAAREMAAGPAPPSTSSLPIAPSSPAPLQAAASVSGSSTAASTPAVSGSRAPLGSAVDSGAKGGKAAPAKPHVAGQKSGKGTKTGGGAGQQQQQARPAVLDVSSKTEDIVQLVSLALLGGPLGSGTSAQVDPFIVRRLRADIEMQLNAIRNVAYATGYAAGKGELVAVAQRRFA